MIDKQRFGNNSYFAIRYHEEKVAKGVAERLTSNIAFISTKDASDQFEFFRITSNRNIKDYVFHASINLGKGEDIPNDDFTKIGEEYVSRMGFENSPYIIYRHYDQAHHHIHVVTSRYTFNENDIVSDSFTKDRANVIIADLEKRYKKKYDLKGVSQTAVENRKKRKEKRLSWQLPEDKSQTMKYLSPPLKPIKRQIAATVLSAFDRAPSLVKAVAYLKRQGINTKFSSNSGGIYGVSFSVTTPAIQKINFERIQQYLDGKKIDPEVEKKLRSGDVVKTENDRNVFLHKNNMILTKEIQDQLLAAIDKQLSFKGSQLHKGLSWSTLSKKFEDELGPGLAERLNQVAMTYEEKDPLLLAYENRYTQGVIESLRSGRSLAEIADIVIDKDGPYWKLSLEREARIRAQHPYKYASDNYKQLMRQIKRIAIKGSSSFEDEVVLALGGLYISNSGSKFLEESGLTVDEKKDIINNNFYQFASKTFNKFQLTQKDLSLIQSLLKKDKNVVTRFFNERSERNYLIMSIAFNHVNSTRELISSVFKNNARTYQTNEIGYALKRLEYSISKDVNDDYKDENDLRRD